jgi:hypothetical protein
MKVQKRNVSAAAVFQKAQQLDVAKNKRGRKSSLAPHRETVCYLRSSRHLSYRQIAEFLNDAGVKTSYQNLLLFTRKEKIGGRSMKRRVKNS